MQAKLTEKDKTTLKYGGVVIVAIIAFFMIIEPFFNSWRNIREDLKLQKSKLKSVASEFSGRLPAKQAALLSLVPKAVIPQPAKVQGPLFRDEFNGQLKKSGIKVQSMKILPVSKSRKDSGVKLLRLYCQAKCELKQVFDLLACLNENSYFVGVEELRLTTNAKDRNKVDMNLTVSTFVK